MVDGERGDDSIEASKCGERLDEIVLEDLDAPIVGEALACCCEHGLGEVKADTSDLGTLALQERQQAAVSRAEVKHATSVIGEMLEQDALSLCTVWESVCPVEIAQDTLGESPLARLHPRIISRRCGFMARRLGARRDERPARNAGSLPGTRGAAARAPRPPGPLTGPAAGCRAGPPGPADAMRRSSDAPTPDPGCRCGAHRRARRRGGQRH